MIKTNKIDEDIIDVKKIFIIVWGGKFKIAAISLICFLVGFVHNHYQSESFLITLKVQPSKNIQFIKFSPINNILSKEPNYIGYMINWQNIFNKFIAEFEDYEELKLALDKNLSSQKKMSKKKASFNSVESILNSNPKLNDNTYSIEFEWHDVEELRKILDETIRLVLINIKKTVIIEINILADSIKRSNEKSMIDLQSKLNAINELKDQYVISKDSLTEFQQYQIFLSHYDVMVQNLLSMNEINSDNIKIIENDNETDWIKSNILNLEKISLKDLNNYTIKAGIFGLLFGIIYVYLTSSFRPLRSNKSKNKS